MTVLVDRQNRIKLNSCAKYRSEMVLAYYPNELNDFSACKGQIHLNSGLFTHMAKTQLNIYLRYLSVVEFNYMAYNNWINSNNLWYI